MSSFCATGILILTLLACDTDHPVQAGSQTSYELWRALNINDYTVDQVRFCFCPDAARMVRITVRSDTIFSVMRLPDSTFLTEHYYLTVDSLFGIIHSPGPDSIIVRYNGTYGFPEHLDVDPHMHPVDGGYIYDTSNLQIP